MRNIEIPDDKFERLSALANAAGYRDVLSLISSLADEPVLDPRGSLTDAELQESAAKIEEGEASIDAGGGRDLKEAIIDIANKHGLNIQQ